MLVSLMRAALNAPQTYALYKHEFEALGNRTQSEYSFNLEIKNGVVHNNIGGSAVARDLLEVLRNSVAAQQLMKEHFFKINLNNEFVLTIQCKP